MHNTNIFVDFARKSCKRSSTVCACVCFFLLACLFILLLLRAQMTHTRERMHFIVRMHLFISQINKYIYINQKRVGMQIGNYVFVRH